jgi:hypothetical protein
MAPELVCAKHGPYDASHGSCPYCQAEAGGGRPVAPPSLDEDDLPTDLGAAPPSPYRYDEDEPTDLGVAHRGGAKFLDDDEITDLGRGRALDQTELYEEDEETGPLGILWLKEGRRRGRIYKIKDGTVVGRDEGDLTLPDDRKVSNPHARFRVDEDEQFVLWDFGSRNGTFVNGDKITAATVLEENDEVKIGETVFVIKIL